MKTNLNWLNWSQFSSKIIFFTHISHTMNSTKQRNKQEQKKIESNS